MESTEARQVFIIEEGESTPSVSGKFVVSVTLGLIVVVVLILIIKLI